MSMGTPVIPTHKLINALRSLDFHHKRQTERINLYKKRGSPDRVEVRKRDYQEVETAKGILRRAGMDQEEIEKFIAECKESLH